MRKFSKMMIAAPALLASATPAFAHPGHDDGTLLSGLIHPFTGVDHLAAMVAVGLWAATRSSRQAWQAPVAFMAALAAGAGLGVAVGAVPGLETMVAASVLILGAMLVMAAQLPSRLALGLIAATGLLHGMAHGVEATGSLPAYFAGFLASSALLHAAGWLAGRSIFARAQGRVVAGLALGATGLALLAA